MHLMLFSPMSLLKKWWADTLRKHQSSVQLQAGFLSVRSSIWLLFLMPTLPYSIDIKINTLSVFFIFFYPFVIIFNLFFMLLTLN